MAKLITVYWRDIPAQVIGKQGRTNGKKVLHPRFARAIDRAAMRAGREGRLPMTARSWPPCALLLVA